MNILLHCLLAPTVFSLSELGISCVVNFSAIESTLFLTMRKVLILATTISFRRSRASAIRDCLADRAGRSVDRFVLRSEGTGIHQDLLPHCILTLAISLICSQ